MYGVSGKKPFTSIPIKIFYFLSLIRLSTIIDVSDSFLIAFYIRFYIRLATLNIPGSESSLSAVQSNLSAQ
jgi:hypothetical protein